MNKNYPDHILLKMTEEKTLKVLFDLASFIAVSCTDNTSSHFELLTHYHSILEKCNFDNINRANKEFKKVKNIDRQFQIYIMTIERLLDQSSKEHHFLVPKGDSSNVSKKFDIVCLSDSIRSAHNIGAFFRTCECFGVKKIILTGLSPTPESQQVQKTAMGTDQRVIWSYAESAPQIIQEYKKKGYIIISAEVANDSIELENLALETNKVLLIFGHEQYGVSQQLLNLSDKTVSIELYGTKNSLNVGISQGIILKKVTKLLLAQTD